MNKKNIFLAIIVFISSVFIFDYFQRQKARLSCYNISDVDAQKAVYIALERNLPSSPDWQEIKALELEVIKIVEPLTPNASADNAEFYEKQVFLGRNGKTLLIGLLSSDCVVGWTE